MKPFKLSRRALLRGLGVGIALPVLDAMLDDHGLFHGVAYANPPAPPVRLVTFHFPVGTHMNSWKPAVGPLTTLPMNLQALQTPIMTLPSGLPTDIRGDINVLSGLGNAAGRVQPSDANGPRGGDHARGTSTFGVGMPCTLNGAGGPSVDQVAAQALGNATRFRSLPIAAETATTGTDSLTSAHLANISWSGPDSPVPADRDPVVLFNRLFSGSGDPAGAARLAADRRSVLDTVAGDLTRLQGRVGTNDRVRVDEHLASIRELERQVASAAVVCTAPPMPGASTAGSPVRARLLIDLLVMALKCDLTRYASYQLANGGSNAAWLWTTVQTGIHTVSHLVYKDASNNYIDSQYGDFNHITQYSVDSFAYLIRQMKAVTEGTGTLLDNSLVYMSSEIAEGSTHSHFDMPILLAGKGGGSVVTGRHIAYPAMTPVNNLYLAMLNFAGVSATHFGMDGTTPLPGLTG